MKSLAEIITTLIAVPLWLAGIVLAHGTWVTLATVFFPPPYAWYLVAERALQAVGWA